MQISVRRPLDLRKMASAIAAGHMIGLQSLWYAPATREDKYGQDVQVYMDRDR